MEGATTFKQLLLSQLDVIQQNALIFLPKFITFLVVVFVGWVLAKLTAAIVLKGSSLFEKMFSHAKFYMQYATTKKRKTRFIKLFSEVCYWLVYLFFFIFALKSLQINSLDIWLQHLLLNVPNLIIALIILFIGFVIGRLIKQAIIHAKDFSFNEHLGEACRYIIIILSFIIAIEQLHINISLLQSLVIVAFSITLAAIGLSFALTLHAVVSPLIKFKLYTKNLHIGQSLEISGLQGEIIAIHKTSIVIASAKSNIMIPMETVLSELLNLDKREAH